MRLAANRERIHGGGAEVIAISVDDEVRQAAMQARWGLTSQRLVADPGGERFLQRLELFNPEDRGGIALPAVLVIAPDGTVAYRYDGRDFADRTTDDEIYAAVDGLGLDAVAPEPVTVDVEIPDDLSGYFRTTDFGPYFRGNRFASIAIAGRLPSKETAAVAREHRMMAEASLEAWDQHRATLD